MSSNVDAMDCTPDEEPGVEQTEMHCHHYEDSSIQKLQHKKLLCEPQCEPQCECGESHRINVPTLSPRLCKKAEHLQKIQLTDPTEWKWGNNFVVDLEKLM